MNNKNIKLLDCTLRDGGYYNNWSFSNNLVKEYLKVMDYNKFNFVEIGFVFFTKDKIGKFGKINNNILKQLNIHNKNNIAIMINASDLLNKNNSAKFNAFLKSKLKVKLIRLACHKNEVKKILPFINILKKNNYKIAINLMQISLYSKKEITDTIKLLNNSKTDLLYFADSLGNLTNNKTQEVSKLFKKFWKGEYGIHAHDNLGFALTNTLVAIENGATWVDSTCLGMGRGPGNTKTEVLYSHIRGNPLDNKILLLNNLINNFFIPLKKKFLWGPNPLYFYSGFNQIHPTYIQSILSEKRHNSDEHNYNLIKTLNNFNAKTFNPMNLNSAKNYLEQSPIGNCSPKKILENYEKIVIIGPGNNLVEEKKNVEKFIKKNNPYVIVLNNYKNFNEKLIHARAFCHPLRLYLDLPKLKSKSKIITPYSMLPINLKKLIDKKKIYDFGLSLKNEINSSENNFCYLDEPLVLGYVILFCAISGNKKIYLAGIDGYKDDSSKRDKVKKMLNNINTQFKIVIESLTKNYLQIPRNYK